MCYYSSTLPKGSFRDVKVGEDLTIQAGSGHHYPVAASDRKIVCMRNRTEVHIADFQFNPHSDPSYGHGVFHDVISYGYHRRDELRKLVGKPLTGLFVEHHLHNAAADWIKVGSLHLHLSWIKAGTKLYTGPARVAGLETRLGVDDPSIIHDHRPLQAPTLQRVIDRVINYCSVTR